MAHQFVREPLRADEADRLANACRSPEEKLVVWTLLDTGLRVSELCSLTRDNVQWQQRSLRVTGKAGPHGSRRKQRIVPLSARVRTILEPYFALNDAWFVGPEGLADELMGHLFTCLATRSVRSWSAIPNSVRSLPIGVSGGGWR